MIDGAQILLRVGIKITGLVVKGLPKILGPGESFHLSLSELQTVCCKFSKNSSDSSCWAWRGGGIRLLNLLTH